MQSRQIMQHIQSGKGWLLQVQAHVMLAFHCRTQDDNKSRVRRLPLSGARGSLKVRLCGPRTCVLWVMGTLLLSAGSSCAWPLPPGCRSDACKQRLSVPQAEHALDTQLCTQGGCAFALPMAWHAADCRMQAALDHSALCTRKSPSIVSRSQNVKQVNLHKPGDFPKRLHCLCSWL